MARPIDRLENAMTDNTSSTVDPKCQKCGLYKQCENPFISADGVVDADVLFVGEAPGATEDRDGKPFVGVSGKLLRGVVEEDLELKAAYTNAVRCRPEDNKTPTTVQINHCRGFLFEDIRKFDGAKLVVVLGNTALRAVTSYSGITGWRGRQVKANGVNCFATYHPAAILPGRGDSDRMQQWIDDMDTIVDILEGNVAVAADSQVEYIYADTVDKAKAMFTELKRNGVCAYDLEFKWLKAYKLGNAILMASFAIDNRAWALPLHHPETPFNDDELLDVLELFEEFLLDEDIKKIGHNVKVDVLLPQATLGVKVATVTGDTLFISKLIDSRGGVHGLSQLSARYLNMGGYDDALKAYVDTHPDANYSKGGNYSNVPIELLWIYAAKDAAATWLLESELLPQLDDKQLNIYKHILIPVLQVFLDMEVTGSALDVDMTAKYKKIYEDKCDELLVALRSDPNVRQLEAEQDKPYNPNSPKQNVRIFYELKGFPILGRTKTDQPSTAADVISTIKDPWLDKYKLYKLYSTALSKYLNKVTVWTDRDGRIRSSYNIVGTETGRSSSQDPNLQNIPAPEKQPGTLLAKYPIKNVFTHTWDGGCLYAADYKTIEMRVKASQCKSKTMIAMFNEGRDLHTFVAAKLYNIPEEEVTKADRHKAKSVNWTMLFEGDWHTLAKAHDLSDGAAQELEADWYAIFPEVLEHNAELVVRTRELGYAVSPFGRRRYFPYITNASTEMKKRSERAAVNLPIQSAASDLLMMSLVVVHDVMKIHTMKSKIINTVHDSIVLDIYPGELQNVHAICDDVMCNIGTYAETYFPGLDFSWLLVPLEVDAEYGSHYGSLKHFS